MPWSDKAGLARAVVILVTILLVSTVTCGLNFAVAVSGLGSNQTLNFLIFTGWAELAGIVASLVGLLMVLVIWLARKGSAETEKESND